MEEVIAWLNKNPGMANLLSPVAAAVVTLFGILWMHRKTSAAKALEATIGQLKASNDHLNLLIDGLRDGEAKAKAANKEAENQCNDLKEGAELDANAIKVLHAEISKLKEHPCIIGYAGVYRYAFPEPGREKAYFCRECFENDLVIRRLDPPPPDFRGKFGYCPKHRSLY